MSSNIDTAQREYYNRPADERFATLDAMIQAAEYDRVNSAERKYNLRDLTAHPHASGIALESPRGTATLTAWAHGQLCRTIGAPAGYLRTLPPQLQADAVNHGLHEAAEPGTVANLLIRQNGGDPLVRACTSETYGRAWDSPLYQSIARHFGDGRSSVDGTWQTPPAWPGSKPSGNYRGDRDSFVIRVDGGSIVADPRAMHGKPGGGLYRGIMIRNSEVGHCSVSLSLVLFDYICGNHMLWGAVLDHKYRRRHVGKHVASDTVREIITLARRVNERAASEDEAIIRSLVEHEIAHTREGVIDELKRIGYTAQDAGAAYDACEREEPISPRSYWGVAAGTTRISQDSGHQDSRLKLDQLAAAVLLRGTKLVTV